MTPPPIDQQVTFIDSADLERSLRFYADVLGLEQLLNQSACRIFRVAGEGLLGICTDPKRAVATEGFTLTFVTPEVDIWHERLRRQGATIVSAPAKNERFNIFNFFARDPDGVLLEFQRFLDPAWPAVGT